MLVWDSLSFKLFDCPAFWLWAYIMKVISETSRKHYVFCKIWDKYLQNKQFYFVLFRFVLLLLNMKSNLINNYAFVAF